MTLAYDGTNALTLLQLSLTSPDIDRLNPKIGARVRAFIYVLTTEGATPKDAQNMYNVNGRCCYDPVIIHTASQLSGIPKLDLEKARDEKLASQNGKR